MPGCDLVGLKLNMSVIASMAAWLKNQFLLLSWVITFLYFF
jgi:hypothetical protein